MTDRFTNDETATMPEGYSAPLSIKPLNVLAADAVPARDQLIPKAYEEGVAACADGKPLTSNPYKGGWNSVASWWSQGYADQAKREALEARRIAENP